MTFPDPSEVASAISASQESNVTTESTDNAQTPQDQASSQAVYELEKIGKFKFQGQEWTPDALKKAILREKDYTTKTQKIAEERKSFETKENFYKNLAWDLEKVKQNPNLIQEFIKVYPAEFHSILKDYLSAASQQVQPQAQQQQQKPQYDIETLSRLERVEKSLAQQDISKNETMIKQTMETMGKKYPDAIPDLVLARAYELYESGTPLNDQTWEQIYKQIDAQGKSFVKARYGEMVKQRKSANEKARGVDSGGGIVGQAPKKLSFKEATEAAIKGLSQGR